MRRPALLAGTAWIVACNALTGLSDDYHLAATADDAGSSGGLEGGADATPKLDGESVSDAAGGAFCRAFEGTTAFCADFEDPSLAAPAFGWDPTGFERTGGDFEVVDGAGKGGSRGLRFHVTPDGSGSMKVSLWRTFFGATPTDAAAYELRFDFRVVTSSIDYAALATFAFPQQGSGLFTTGLAWYGSGGYYDTTDPPRPGDMNRFSATPGPWHAAKMVLTREGQGPTFAFELALDDTVIDRKAGVGLGSPNAAQIRVGTYFTSSSAGELEVVFDNVVAERK